MRDVEIMVEPIYLGSNRKFAGNTLNSSSFIPHPFLVTRLHLALITCDTRFLVLNSQRDSCRYFQLLNSIVESNLSKN